MRACTFIVERYIPHLRSADIEPLCERLTAASAELQAEGRDIRWLRSFALLDDETCLCLFSARSRNDVAEANHRAGAAYDRIIETVTIEPDSTETVTASTSRRLPA